MLCAAGAKEKAFTGERDGIIKVFDISEGIHEISSVTLEEEPNEMRADFDKDGKICYSYTQGSRKGSMLHYEPASGEAVELSNVYGDIRRGKDGIMLVCTEDAIISLDGNPDNDIMPDNNKSIFSLGLPLQNVKTYTKNENEITAWREVGLKSYELSDHLGNVRATVSDRKTAESNNGIGSNKAITNEVNLLSVNNYYPFGMMQPNRNFSAESYRFGFNGKEMDNEISGTGNSYDYGFRIYNPRIARFLSVDPLTKGYPWWTPYQFAGNIPIRFVDLDGKEIADPEQFTKAREYMDAWYSSETAKPVFSQISKKVVYIQIITNLELASQMASNPQSLTPEGYEVMHQVTDACGPSALAYIFILYNPIKYVKATTELYQNGTTNITGTDQISVSDGMKQNKFSDGKAYGAGAVDYLLIGALGQSENYLIGDFENDNAIFDRGTTPWEFLRMAKRLGLEAETSTFYLGQSERMFKKFDKAFSENKIPIVFETHEVSGTKDKGSFKALLNNTIGIHYIGIHRYDSEKGNKLMIWTYGRIQTRNVLIPGEMAGQSSKITKKEFLRGTKGYFIFKNKVK